MAIITTRNLHYQYRDDDKGRPYALKDVNLELEPGQFYAILGSTGSGKSTLLQHFNGIYQPTEGQIQVLDIIFEAGQKKKGLKGLRSRVGLVFQFPEQQLFEETVEKDLMFGPIQFGSSQEEAREAARTALAEVGLPAELLERSPFELSGGQIRKVAIATVLASKPELLVLDEPTATLDPVSRKELIELLQRLRREEGRTVVMVTHRLDEVFCYADQFVLMKEGTVTFVGSKEQLMDAPERLAEAGIIEPAVMTLALEASRKTGIPAREMPCHLEEWVDWLCELDVLKGAVNEKAEQSLHTDREEAPAAAGFKHQESAAKAVQTVHTGEEG
ncbi:ATP-binding cassette domain-containing protein [Paenibacillus sp. 1001270B_150601_E10]|uniref:ATP-binding cassette domain-containing protein n=1 Tax=Paenibacillus sp. 1001270B_150601_E10 TaxID=2787079 RepID=UPI0018A0BFF7|nr:ATP-binding cassette domain-containing protein [Paenibacillus sp. 1001270B_150601_E10]